MTDIEYILNHTTKQRGVTALYKCHFTNQIISWEDMDMHLNYLRRNKIIQNYGS